MCVFFAVAFGFEYICSKTVQLSQKHLFQLKSSFVYPSFHLLLIYLQYRKKRCILMLFQQDNAEKVFECGLPLVTWIHVRKMCCEMTSTFSSSCTKIKCYLNKVHTKQTVWVKGHLILICTSKFLMEHINHCDVKANLIYAFYLLISIFLYEGAQKKYI